MFITVDNPVVWDGMFHATVHCAASAPAPCTGDVDFRVKGGDQPAVVRIAPGKSEKVAADPGDFSVGKTETTVVVRIEPTGEPSVDVTRRLVHRAYENSAVGNGGMSIRHVVHDKRGDAGGSNVLDLRVVHAWIHRGRLVLRWTCWGTVTPAKMDHDSSNFAASVRTNRNQNNNTDYNVGFFYWHGHPFAQAGRTQFGNPNVRTSLPDRHSAQVAIPLSTFGHPKRFYIFMYSNPYVGPHSWSDGADREEIYFPVK